MFLSQLLPGGPISGSYAEVIFSPMEENGLPIWSLESELENTDWIPSQNANWLLHIEGLPCHRSQFGTAVVQLYWFVWSIQSPLFTLTAWHTKQTPKNQNNTKTQQEKQGKERTVDKNHAGEANTTAV